MRFSSSNVQKVMKVGGLVLLWLLCASIATAAPVHQRRAKSRVCDPHSRFTLRTIAANRPVAGPISIPSTRAQAGLADPTLLFQRGGAATFGDEVAAISNDAPAARIDGDVGLVPAFEPLGVLVRSVHRLPQSDAFSPRSPRGPPYSA
jgi:hypothetical protein